MRSDDVSRIGQFSFAGTHAMLTFQRRFPHSPEAVWAAITDPKQLAAWYMQRVFIDGRLGGSIEFVSDGGKLHTTGQILAWEPPRLLEYEWKVKPRREMPSGEDTIVRWELLREGPGTVLMLTHRNLTQGKNGLPLPRSVGCSQIWNGSTRPASARLCTSLGLPNVTISFPGFSFSLRISRRVSPRSRVALAYLPHGVSLRVFEATSFGVLFITSAPGEVASVWFGHAPAMIW